MRLPRAVLVGRATVILSASRNRQYYYPALGQNPSGTKGADSLIANLCLFFGFYDYNNTGADLFDSRCINKSVPVCHYDDDGSLVIRARLPADEGAVVLQAFNAA